MVLGGRISVVDGRNIRLDRVSSTKAGDRLILNLPSGKVQGRTIQAVNGKVVTGIKEGEDGVRARAYFD